MISDSPQPSGKPDACKGNAITFPNLIGIEAEQLCMSVEAHDNDHEKIHFRRVDDHRVEVELDGKKIVIQTALLLIAARMMAEEEPEKN